MHVYRFQMHVLRFQHHVAWPGGLRRTPPCIIMAPFEVAPDHRHHSMWAPGWGWSPPPRIWRSRPIHSLHLGAPRHLHACGMRVDASTSVPRKRPTGSLPDGRRIRRQRAVILLGQGEHAEPRLILRPLEPDLWVADARAWSGGVHGEDHQRAACRRKTRWSGHQNLL